MEIENPVSGLSNKGEIESLSFEKSRPDPDGRDGKGR